MSLPRFEKEQSSTMRRRSATTPAAVLPYRVRRREAAMTMMRPNAKKKQKKKKRKNNNNKEEEEEEEVFVEEENAMSRPLLLDESNRGEVWSREEAEEEEEERNGEGKKEDKNTNNTKRGTSRGGVLLLGSLFLNSFLSNALVSLIAPFLPHHITAVLHGSSSLVGILMSAYPLAVFFTLPICNILCRRVGRRTTLLVGELVQGVAAIFFGYGEVVTQLFVSTSSAGYTRCVIGVYFAARIIEGFGAAAANLAITSIVADHFKQSLGKIMGVNETIIGLGFTLGPPIGSALYAVGGFGLPFVIFGSLLLGLLVVMLFTVTDTKPSSASATTNSESKGIADDVVLSKQAAYDINLPTKTHGSAEELALLGETFDDDSSSSNGMLDTTKIVNNDGGAGVGDGTGRGRASMDDKMTHQGTGGNVTSSAASPSPSSTSSSLRELATPEVVLLSLAVAVGVGSFAYQEVFLAPYEGKQLRLGVNEVGFLFIPSSVAYSILGPFCGYLVDRGWSGEMVALGHLGGGLCNLVLAIKNIPLWISKAIGGHVLAWAWTTQLLTLSCFGATQAFVLIPALPLMRASVGEEDDAATETIVGVFFAMQMLGSTLGSVVGGFINDAYGYYVALAVLGGINILYSNVILISWRIWCRRQTSRRACDSDGHRRGGDGAGGGVGDQMEIGNAIANATSHQGGVNVSAYAGIARRPSVPRDIVSLSAPGLGADMHLLRQTSTISTPRARFAISAIGVSARSPQVLSSSFNNADHVLGVGLSGPMVVNTNSNLSSAAGSSSARSTTADSPVAGVGRTFSLDEHTLR